MAKTIIHDRLIEKLNVKNIARNGGFRIDQRQNGAFYNNPASGSVTLDGWTTYKESAGGPAGAPDVDVQRITDYEVGKEYTCKLTVNSKGTGTTYNNFQLHQHPENWKDYNGKTVSISVEVKTDIAGFAIDLGAVTSNRSVAHPGDDAWHTLTITYSIPAAAGNLLFYGFGWLGIPGLPNTGTAYVRNLMIVIGSEPVEFVPLSPEEDLARCQRFYEPMSYLIQDGLGGKTASSIYLTQTFVFATTKAAVPNISSECGYVYEDGFGSNQRLGYYNGNTGGVISTYDLYNANTTKIKSALGIYKTGTNADPRPRYWIGSAYFSVSEP